jgi:hypothetical protein
MEARLFTPGEFPFTPEWYEHREHAPHREQLPHWDRMDAAARLVILAVEEFDVCSVVDLGAGDGGLLGTIQDGLTGVLAPDRFFGYDLMPSNVRHANEVRCVDIRYGNFLAQEIEWGHLTLITECLEHLEDPHGTLRMIASDWIVASSPSSETVEDHTPEHAWCWNEEGYAEMIQKCGFKHIIEHEVVGNGDMEFQVILARKPA